MSRPVGLPGRERGLLILLTLSPGSNKRPRKQLVFCLTPVCLLLWFLAQCRILPAHLGLPVGLGEECVCTCTRVSIHHLCSVWVLQLP